MNNLFSPHASEHALLGFDSVEEFRAWFNANPTWCYMAKVVMQKSAPCQQFVLAQKFGSEKEARAHEEVFLREQRMAVRRYTKSVQPKERLRARLRALDRLPDSELNTLDVARAELQAQKYRDLIG